MAEPTCPTCHRPAASTEFKGKIVLACRSCGPSMNGTPLDCFSEGPRGKYVPTFKTPAGYKLLAPHPGSEYPGPEWTWTADPAKEGGTDHDAPLEFHTGKR